MFVSDLGTFGIVTDYFFYEVSFVELMLLLSRQIF